MREIEFRGKVRECNEWVYGSLVYMPFDDGSEYCCIMDNNCDDEYLPYINNDSGTFDGYMTPVDKDTIGQFTGLCDKNGTKIFDGDIVRVFSDCDGYYIEKEYIYGVVVYEDEFGFCYEISFNHIRNSCDEYLGNHRDDIEVIGNIYDNGDLINDN